MIHQLSISVSPHTHWQIVQSILPQWFISSVLVCLHAHILPQWQIVQSILPQWFISSVLVCLHALTDRTEHITAMIHQLSISVSPRTHWQIVQSILPQWFISSVLVCLRALTDRTEHITTMIHQFSISVSPRTLTDRTEHITTMIHQLSISVSPRTHWQIVQSILPQWFISSVLVCLRSTDRSYRAYYRNDSSAQY